MNKDPEHRMKNERVKETGIEYFTALDEQFRAKSIFRIGVALGLRGSEPVILIDPNGIPEQIVADRTVEGILSWYKATYGKHYEHEGETNVE